MIERKLSKKLSQVREYFPIISIVGPRQSGKTTLAKKEFTELPYFTMEDIDTRKYVTEDPRGFLNSLQDGAVIDEAQHVPDLFSYLQTHVDATRQNGKFVLTGSQNFLMHSKISQSLAGRVAVLSLLPTSLEERGVTEDILQSTMIGGYPATQKMPEDILSLWLDSYLQTYVERDVRSLKYIGDLLKFRVFIELCAARTGQILNISSLALDAGIARKTAIEWLSILEASFIIFLLKPYHNNYNKRLIKNPKLYFFDTAIASHLIGFRSKNDLMKSHLKRHMVENFVMSELYKAYTNRLMQPKLYFWRDQTGNEIDCILEGGNRNRAIEIKSSETINDEYYKNLRYWQKLADNTDATLIYGGDMDQSRGEISTFGWKNLADTEFVDKLLYL